MPTIVKHLDKKTGNIRVYESTPHYDPITKQSRPRRKYLGTMDPETGDLIPSSGRRGRKAGVRNKSANQNVGSDRSAAFEKAVSLKNDEIASLKSEIADLKAELKTYKKTCDMISRALDSLPEESA